MGLFCGRVAFIPNASIHFFHATLYASLRREIAHGEIPRDPEKQNRAKIRENRHPNTNDTNEKRGFKCETPPSSTCVRIQQRIDHGEFFFCCIGRYQLRYVTRSLLDKNAALSVEFAAIENEKIEPQFVNVELLALLVLYDYPYL